MRPQRLVVLGTGTGVGKTHVGCALVAAWSEVVGAGEVWACKPIESGVGPDASGSDGARLREASLFHVKRRSGADDPEHGSQAPLVPEALAVPPYRFADPVSPHLAARRAGGRIDLGSVRRWLGQVQGAGHLLVETAGGLCSPLAPGMSNLELALGVGPAAWLLVAPDRLGVLHDIAAVRAALSRAGHADTVTVALSTPAEPDASTGTNASELVTLSLARAVAVFPRESPYSSSSASVAHSLLIRLGLLAGAADV
jgi:dethiobiotin synthetase